MRVESRKNDCVTNLNRYQDTQRRFNKAIDSARSIFLSFDLMFRKCAFWQAEQTAAQKAFARAEADRRMPNGRCVIEVLDNSTQKIVKMRTEWMLNMARFHILKDFEAACREFKTVCLEADKLKGQYGKSKKWQIETAALKARLHEAAATLEYRENSYIREYKTCSEIEMQYQINYIKIQLKWFKEEIIRLNKLAFALESNKTQDLIDKLTAKYDANNVHYAFLRSEMRKIKELLNCATEEDKKYIELLASARQRLEALAAQNIFGLLANQERASDLLREELLEFERLVSRLSFQHIRDYSWSTESLRLNKIISDAHQALGMAKGDLVDGNELTASITKLGSLASRIRNERAVLITEEGQRGYERNCASTYCLYSA